jgi:murein DD-endopeptidase MepM/ murein hydrolase activator NlpD
VENYISKGQIIRAGDLIGMYADVGYSFGAHLHLNIYNMAWRAIDPTPILKSINII